ncbi:Bug family tripartite tricarboxylate transporter substrate binding protein [Variovorax ginsengisoli]|jgi:tripartite-type tricarboxylate transporter receptor subunit TctC|uniref:Tripartite tricarboxylate transporter substrate binding protein n=1 Tax=Variovorax ginsengisoli TaxID=363844 RepID=A0ABT8S5X1_9BURK|nr:tripartite tricarboxylate transporter substrate binding protein [Variovorax ginsengisoli]MDN8615146.1 tripartite tricarboxylate transporter substrate binding protein [Variovorax ginsengisoli]MDO1534316.1 tripartite tricarboxylate transporter substrate binding protein [Variovorax ginsengisoli]
MIDLKTWSRRLLAGTAAVAALAAHAQDYPTKPVRIIAPFPAGSGPDANAREIAAELTKILGQSFFVENRPGASNIIGTEVAAKAPADGYSLYIGTTSSLSVVPHLYARLPFNAEKDFAPVSLLGVLNTGLIANPNLPAKDARALIAELKARPDSVTVATAGIGSYSHLSGVWFNNAAGVKTNLVPYNSNSPYTDLMAGQVQAMFDGLPAAASNIRAGKLKLLAITGKQRHPSFPDVPTFAEAGLPDYAPIAWQGILAPAGTPKPILDKLSAAMQKACQSPELAKRWTEYGGALRCNTPAEFSAFIEADRAMWGKVIREANIKLD